MNLMHAVMLSSGGTFLARKNVPEALGEAVLIIRQDLVSYFIAYQLPCTTQARNMVRIDLHLRCEILLPPPLVPPW